VGQFHKIIANLRTALESTTPSSASPAETVEERSGDELVPVAPAARRAELSSRFARELEAVNGHFLGVFLPAEAADRIVALAREIKARTAALGEGVLSDTGPIGDALERAGLTVIRARRVDEGTRAEMCDRIAQSDLGVAEAHYAVAASGTLAVVASEDRPSVLTLLPPANVIIVHVDRILPDLAAVLGALGAETLGTQRVALITGPSRTADIEKRIVLGVHGPKELYALLIWPRDD
jgi:L-lactate utilization protein LutC